MYKDTLHTVDDSDLEQLLMNLGEFDAVQTGVSKCKYCKDAVTMENLAALFPEGGDIKFVCSKSECIASLVEAQVQAR